MGFEFTVQTPVLRLKLAPSPGPRPSLRAEKSPLEPSVAVFLLPWSQKKEHGWLHPT
ncbi:hypothetical protein BDZ97DRAFT_1821658 [Flammula alnicola]|nr:hypothetical protein BDZ97DRAFT_1856402 [Flammula alnicola]KAF8963082.1 hypothetical protein BDZ97DRAFT_1821658 [Flammula alnicola]